MSSMTDIFGFQSIDALYQLGTSWDSSGGRKRKRERSKNSERGKAAEGFTVGFRAKKAINGTTVDGV